jgi:hypothetical protein
MIRQLREKQNREVGEYNNAINRQVINKMHSQVALWESDRPVNTILDNETISNYEETVKDLGDLLTNKLTTIETIDLNNSGSEKQYKEVIDNSEFVRKYNLLVKPLSSGSVLKKTKSAVENLVQPLQPVIEKITIAFSKLVDNKRAVGLSRINPILSSYSLFDYVKQQYRNNVFTPILTGNLQSYYSNNFVPRLGPSIVGRLDEALDEYSRQPNLRKEAVASQVGRLSPEELKGILKLQGINEYPLSSSIGLPTGSEERVAPKQPLTLDEEVSADIGNFSPATPAETQEVQEQQKEEGKRLIRYWRQFRTKTELGKQQSILKRELTSLKKITGTARQKDLIKIREEEAKAIEKVINEFDRGLAVLRAPTVSKKLVERMPSVPVGEPEAIGEGRPKRIRKIIT